MKSASALPPVVQEIARFNRGLDPKLVRVKLKRMRDSAFAFFRGTNHLFARAWPDVKPIDVGPALLICGDLHLENVGAFRTDDGTFRYDINDFDEALIGPCTLDLVRCTASILLAAQEWKLTPLDACRMGLAFLEQYQTSVTEAAKLGVTGEVAPGTGKGPIWDLLGATALGSHAKLLEHNTKTNAAGELRIRRCGGRHPALGKKTRQVLQRALQRFARETPVPDCYRMLDASGRIAGVGSLGLRRYLVLVAGDGSTGSERLLDIKAASPSALLSCTDEPQVDTGGNEALRVVEAQRQLQAKPTAGLDVLKMGGTWYRMREMIPDENRSTLDRLQHEPKRLRRAVKIVGRLAGWSHIRGCRLPRKNRTAALVRWVSGPALHGVLAAAVVCATRSRTEYQEFKRFSGSWQDVLGKP